MDKEAVFNALNRIMELELAGAAHHTHYALMVHSFHRLPIVAWLKQQAEVRRVHTRQADEPVTWLGGHPSLSIDPLIESVKHDIGDILLEPRDGELEALNAYYDLFDLSKDKNARLEEYARDMIAKKLMRRDEGDKMSVKLSYHVRGIPRARLELCR